MLSSVMRFMCGHRLHGRMNSTSGVSTATLEAIEHSVTSMTFCGRLVLTHLIMAEVEPVKSAAFDHFGRALGMRDDLARLVIDARMSAMSCAVNRSCTSQRALPRDDLHLGLATARTSPGTGRECSRTRGTPRLSTTFTAFDEVQHDIALGFHRRRRVNVRDDRHAGIGHRARQRTSSGVIDAASEQPARKSGMSTVLSGRKSFEVSAMKCTPA